MNSDQEVLARGRFWTRVWSVLWLLPAWFAPHSRIRVFFHRLRGVRIGRGVEVGYFVILGNVEPSRSIIEDRVTITARCTILEHDNAMFYVRQEEVRSGVTVVGAGAFVGIGSVVLPGVRIGAGAIVGALSLVNKNVEAGTIVGGVPARPISSAHT